MLHVNIYLKPSLNILNAHSDSLNVLMAVTIIMTSLISTTISIVRMQQ